MGPRSTRPPSRAGTRGIEPRNWRTWPTLSRHVQVVDKQLSDFFNGKGID